MANNYVQFSEEIVCENEEQALWLIEQLSKDTDDGGPSCDANLEDKKNVWIHADEQANLETMVDVLCEFQERFKLKEAITVSWAYTCDKPRLSEFGGGAVVVKDGKDHWIDAQSWARQKIEELEHAKRNILKDALHAAIDKYAAEEGTDLHCAFRDALADMRHIAGDHMLDYHLEDVRAEGLYKEERELVGAVVICSICGKAILEVTAHLHQNKWIGDECCWDERLRNTE